MELSFERGEAIGREVQLLPAATYNRLTVLFARGSRAALFVPIRSLQYLAIVDREEVIFVDGVRKRFIALAWQNFQRKQREDLQAPVEYERVFYERAGIELSHRLPGEFLGALLELEKKQAPGQPTGNDVTRLQPQAGARRE